MLKWFDAHQRNLPWRTDKTLYRVWVSEIMLQQTQVATVVDYYLRFMERFPDVQTLAAANQDEVLKLWEGLGYYRRARQLHAAARFVMEQHNGQFPKRYATVLKLPGIGRYTAGAILSISQDQKFPILEGNTVRLFARLLAMDTDPHTSPNNRTLWEFSESLLPDKRCGDFNQALMELGNTVCQPKSPKCSLCPIRTYCPTFAQGLQEEIPVPKKKMRYESVCEAVVIVHRRKKYLVRLCHEGERWAGLWDFPRFKTGEKTGKQNRLTELQDELFKLTGLTARLRDTNQTFDHAVTRFRITLGCFMAEEVRGRLNKNGPVDMRWLNENELNDLPMSASGRKIAKKLPIL